MISVRKNMISEHKTFSFVPESFAKGSSDKIVASCVVHVLSCYINNNFNIFFLVGVAVGRSLSAWARSKNSRFFAISAVRATLYRDRRDRGAKTQGVFAISPGSAVVKVQKLEIFCDFGGTGVVEVKNS